MIVTVIPSRIPGNVWRPWLCVVRCVVDGKQRDYPTGRKFTQAAAEREASRLARHIAAGQPYELEMK